MVRTRLNIGCRYSTPVRERPLHPTRGHFTPEPSQTQAPVTPATEPERRAGGGLTIPTPGMRVSQYQPALGTCQDASQAPGRAPSRSQTQLAVPGSGAGREFADDRAVTGSFPGGKRQRGTLTWRATQCMKQRRGLRSASGQIFYAPGPMSLSALPHNLKVAGSNPAPANQKNASKTIS